MIHINFYSWCILSLCLIVLPVVFSPSRLSTGENAPLVILSIGDSITEGFIEGVVDTSNRYTSVLERSLQTSGRNVSISNHAGAGQTSVDGALALAGYLASDKPDVVTILFGANDLLRENEELTVSPSNFGEALRFMVKETRAEGAVPILLSLVPMVPDKFYERHDRSLYEVYGGVETLWQSYDQVIRNVAAEEGTELVDVGRLFGDSLSVLIGTDGVHPSVRGHELIGLELSWLIIDLPVTGGPDGGQIAPGTLFDLYVFPNPCRLESGALVKLHVRTEESGTLGAKVYDISGRAIVTLPETIIGNPGEHWVVWDGRDGGGNRVAPGIYLFQVEWSRQGGGNHSVTTIRFAIIR